MSSEPHSLLGEELGQGRRTAQSKKPTTFLESNGLSQRIHYEAENLSNDILHEVSEKYLEPTENYVGFTSPQFFHELQMEQNNAKKTKSQQNTMRRQLRHAQKEKSLQKMPTQHQSNIQHNNQRQRSNRKQFTTVYGNNQMFKSKLTERKFSDAHKKETVSQHIEDINEEEQEEVKNYNEGYYQEPYTKLLRLNSRSNSMRKKKGENNESKVTETQRNYNFDKNAFNNYEHEQFLKQLEGIIYTEVRSMELKELKGNYILEHITDDLELEIESYQNKICQERLSPEELLQNRMHVQAIAKLMVFVHGKSEFRLVASHYYIGEAYRINGCYEQAIDHFTIALKKNAKLTEIKETKIYHSFILTSLSECYFELEMYDDTLEILLRAYEIQQCYVNSELKVNNCKTIRLISQCYLKMKNYRQAIDYMEKICLIIQKLKGSNSKEYAEIKFEKAVIAGQEGNRLGAIQQVKAAIELVQVNTTIEPFLKNLIVLEYSKKLADFLQKFGDSESQVQCLKQMLKIIESQSVQGNAPKNFFLKHIIAIKKKIIVIAVRHSDFQMAIKELQQVLVLEEEKYTSESLFVGKTLKMLGLVHLHLGNDRHAEEYFKRCYKLDKQFTEMRGQMKDLKRILKLFGYDKKNFLKKKSKQKGKKMSFM